jgi:hypothetical protein
MSNYLTIAVITAAIQEIVQGAVQEVVPGANVRVGPPRAVSPGEKEVNIYLYQISPNAELRNDDLATRRADGVLIRQPAAAIRLHYLISFAGEDHLATEIMLGRVVSVLHALPVLTGAELARIVSASGSYPYLQGSDLPAQEERVKLTPEYLSLEELSKLWTVFFQLAHRPSLQYLATPVQIDADLTPVKIPTPQKVETGVEIDDDKRSREDIFYAKPPREA